MISLCMIVKNEEDNLDRCLKSSKGIADEIIIVDTGSTDSTIEIAKKYTDKVYFFEWIYDFSAARNFSISKATGDWILILDADDEVSSKSKYKIRELASNYSVDVYLFNTLNVMDENNKDNIIINQNPRLFQNKPGYKYEGEVHNQLISVIQRVNPHMVMKFVPIDIYHYGYLNSNIVKQKKRERNMKILRTQLEKRPNDPFVHYNIANEYFALNNKKEAYNHYLFAYNRVKPSAAFYPRLIIRMLLCCMDLGLYDDIHIYSNKALKYYPNFTDIYYINGIIAHIIGRPTAAVRAFEKAIEIGEPPPFLAYFKGSGNYKSLENLYKIYFEFEDYEKCLECCFKLFKYPKKINIDFIKTMIHCMYKLKTPKEGKEKILKIILDNNKKHGYIYASNILLIEKDYKLALEYIDNGLKHLELQGIEPSYVENLADTLKYYKGVCEFNTKNYKNSILTLININSKNVMYYNIPHIFLSGIFTKDDKAIKFSINNKSYAGKVCKVLYDILNNMCPKKLTNDKEESLKYKSIIFLMLRISLNIDDNTLFKQILKLLNLINCNDIHLELGKLFYEYRKFDISKKELILSIAQNHVIDKKGAKIFYDLL